MNRRRPLPLESPTPWPPDSTTGTAAGIFPGYQSRTGEAGITSKTASQCLKCSLSLLNIPRAFPYRDRRYKKTRSQAAACQAHSGVSESGAQGSWLGNDAATPAVCVDEDTGEREGETAEGAVHRACAAPGQWRAVGSSPAGEPGAAGTGKSRGTN